MSKIITTSGKQEIMNNALKLKSPNGTKYVISVDDNGTLIFAGGGKEVKHYALNSNIFRGKIYFNNTKIGRMFYKKQDGSQVNFNNEPFTTLTIEDTTSSPAVKETPLKNGNGKFIGIKIKFQNKFTGWVSWEVKE